MPNVFVLKDHLKERKDFNVEIAGKVYTIPHTSKLDYKDVSTLTKIQAGDYGAMYDLLTRYIGADVSKSLNIGELEALYKGWTEFIKETEGATLGE